MQPLNSLSWMLVVSWFELPDKQLTLEFLFADKSWTFLEVTKVKSELSFLPVTALRNASPNPFSFSTSPHLKEGC